MRTRRLAACALCGLALAAAASHAAQWIVDDDGPADFRTLQSAADSPLVHAGDTLLVRPGRYVGNLVLDLKDLQVIAEQGPLRTTLDGDLSGSVVSIYQRSAATRVEGFTITRGRGATGGGVWILGGAPVVTRNIIEGNSAVGGYLGYGYGGGIEVYSSAATITRNVIRGNTALDGGGGIDLYYAGPSTPGSCCPVVAQNTIVSNHVTGATGAGGGLFVSASGPLIAANVIATNTAPAGGGLYVEKLQGVNDTPDVASNLFHADANGEVDSNVNWRLPSSNVMADPLLEWGPGGAVWPRSVSPAVDAAPASLASAPDLRGGAPLVDGDLDGLARGDLGAIEGGGDITGLDAEAAGAGGIALSWDGSINPAVLFDLYRDAAGPFVGGAPACVASGLATPSWVDLDQPVQGSAFFYLVAGRGAVAGGFGVRSDLTPRPAPAGCFP